MIKLIGIICHLEIVGSCINDYGDFETMIVARVVPAVQLKFKKDHAAVVRVGKTLLYLVVACFI